MPEFPVASPDGKLVITWQLDSTAGSLSYRVESEGRTVVRNSRFDLVCNGVSWKEGVSLADQGGRTEDRTWKPLYGERARVRDHFAERTFLLARRGQPKLSLELVVRAYNEGVAFRGRFLETGKVYGTPPIRIDDEPTEYRFEPGAEAWFTPMAQTPYQRLPLRDWPGPSERPLVLKLPNGLYAALAEAEMVNYARTKFRLSPEQPDTVIGVMHGAVDELAPFETPWRVIMVAKTPGQLLEQNDLLLNLNPPCAIADPSWIKPGKIMRDMTVSTEGSRKVVDFAAAHGIGYIDLSYWNGDDTTTNGTRVDIAAWRNPKPLDMAEVIGYARSKGVGVFLYVNQSLLARELDNLAPLYASWGVAGLKFGFVHVGSHRWTTWLHQAVRKCADHRLMVNIHDEYRPTGFSRTYPNLLTQEGIGGNEEMPDATHNTTVAFCRFLAGAADYTICYYSARKEFGRQGKALQTTPAHQLALPVIYYSPLQYIYWYDTPDDYQGEPEAAFWSAMPTVWDDTKVVAGEIGQYIAVARRSGSRWFVGAITNNDPRELDLPLAFLDPGAKYQATIYRDDPSASTRTRVGVRKIPVNSTTVLPVRLAPSGGEALVIEPL
jgi:alpha-glucosidase